MIENGRNINRIQVGKSFEAVFQDYFIPFHPLVHSSMRQRLNASGARFFKGRTSQWILSNKWIASFISTTSIFDEGFDISLHGCDPPAFQPPVISRMGTSHGEKSPEAICTPFNAAANRVPNYRSLLFYFHSLEIV